MARPRPIKIDRSRSGVRLRVLNLGPRSSASLEEIGIRSADQIRRLGPIEVCRRLRRAGRPVSVLMAYALEGAITQTHWRGIPAESRAWLRAEFARLQPTRGAG